MTPPDVVLSWDDYQKLRLEAAMLREALEKSPKHGSGCKNHWVDKCDCGWNPIRTAALSAPASDWLESVKHKARAEALREVQGYARTAATLGDFFNWLDQEAT